MAACLIGLGSNLGDRRASLEAAVEQLSRRAGVRVVRHSRWRETAPVGGPAGQDPFLNGAALLEASLKAHEVFRALEQVERSLGRRRLERWGPRTLDLDLLLYDDLVLETPELVVPHPRMAWRRFVLEPAAEVAPAMVHPGTGWTIARLLTHLNTAAPYLAITGTIAAGKTMLAEGLAKATSARLIAERIDLRRLESFYHDPSRNGWEMELQVLEQRADLLSLDRADWSGETTVSDFWFDQSVAFASVWLSPNQMGAFLQKWQSVRQTVVKPKLIILLRGSTDELLRRIRLRGRPGERELRLEIIDQIQEAIRAEALQSDRGPVMTLRSEDPDRALQEALAAVHSMR